MLNLNRPPSFSLFLRPFSVTRRLPIRNPYKILGFLWAPSVGEPDTIDLETLLSDAFSPENPLVGLGSPGEAIGIGRIEASDAEWKSQVERLASASRSIFVIPSDHEGTKWEINHLRAHSLLAKTVFVMPPKGAPDVQLNWEESRREVPIEMPPYSDTGMLYTVDDDGKVRRAETLSVRTTAALVTRIRRVSNHDQTTVASKLTDRPIFHVFGWGLTYMLLWPLLLIGLLVLFLLLIR